MLFEASVLWYIFFWRIVYKKHDIFYRSVSLCSMTAVNEAIARIVYLCCLITTHSSANDIYCLALSTVVTRRLLSTVPLKR